MVSRDSSHKILAVATTYPFNVMASLLAETSSFRWTLSLAFDL